MNVCLVNPPSLRSYFNTYVYGAPNPSLAHIGGYLIEHSDYKITLIDAKLENLNIKETYQRIMELQPDIVGISTTTSDMPVSKDLARFIKTEEPSIQVIVGGAHPSALPRETLINEPNFDIAVISEGEATFLELINSISKNKTFEKIKGCAYRKDGNIVLTPPIDPIDLNELPIPAWHLMPVGKKYFIQISRGCPARCSFCYRMFGRKVRTVPPKRVIAEIERVLDLCEPDEFVLGAATFGIPRKHSMAVINALIESELNKRIKWQTVTRVDVSNYELFSMMKKAGCYRVGLGIESGDNNILRQTGKNISTDQIRMCVQTIKNIGIVTTGFFIFGHPFETKETVKRTSEFAIEINPTRINLGIMTPWPGTEVYRLAKDGLAGYRLSDEGIEGVNKHFGRRALYFDNISIRYMQWLRVKTYFYLYWKNRRIKDGLKFFKENFIEGIRLLYETMLSQFHKK